MKVFKLFAMSFAIAALAMTTASCSKSEKSENNAEETTEAKAEENEEAKVAVVELSENEDDAIRPGGTYEKPYLLDFNATWCGPCKQFRPTFDKYAEEYGDKYNFVSIDIDKCPETAAAFGVEAIPYIAYVDENGIVVKIETNEFEQFFQDNK